MKRIEIFFRLKREETWRAIKQIPEVMLFIFLLIVVVCLLLGIVAGLGYVGCLILGWPLKGTHIVDAGFILLYGGGFLALCFWGIIAFKRWIQSNWEEAGRLAEYYSKWEN